MALNPAELVLWADEALLVVNKPPGLPTLVDGYDPEAPYLVGELKNHFELLWVVHRLDRDTSGVIVFARTPEAQRELNSQFEKRQVSKIYHALVVGDPPWQEKRISLALRPDGDRKHRTVVDNQGGKRAATDLRVLARFGQYTLIEARPATGRRHQIRVHLANQSLPLAADALYGSGRGILLSELKSSYKKGKSDETPLLGRVGLHAWALALRHPTTGEKQRLEAPYPKDFSTTLKQLHKFCAQ